MAPSLVSSITNVVSDVKVKTLSNNSPSRREPLQLSGALDKFESFDVTPTIGREFKNADLAEWLKAPNSDELIRDLAVTSMYCSWSESSTATWHANFVL
jgi:hypothetical protein